MWSRKLVALLALVAMVFSAVPAMAAVHAGDELFVTVYDHPELTGPVLVDSSNHISLPLVGAVDVSGLDTQQIAARVTTVLRQYVIKPAVNVQLKTQAPVVFISGGPGGSLLYQPGMTLVAALGTLAPRMQAPLRTDNTGLNTGNNQGANFPDLQRSAVDLHRVALVRDDKTVGTFDAVALFAQGASGPQLQAGDTLAFVNKPLMIHVGGEVARPGYAFLSTDEPLNDAIAQAGGLLATAATSRIDVRGDGNPQLLAIGDPRWNEPGKTGISITVPAAPNVNIVGLVEKPGPVALRTDNSLMTALYAAGGPTKYADLAHVQVMQGGTRTTYDVTKLVHGDVSQNPTLHDGDVVFVPEGRKISTDFLQTLFNAAFLFRL